MILTVNFGVQQYPECRGGDKGMKKSLLGAAAAGGNVLLGSLLSEAFASWSESGKKLWSTEGEVIRSR